jgi:hypothetical protein
VNQFSHPRRGLLGALLTCVMLASPASAGNPASAELLARTATQASNFLDQFSQVKCTEHVTQEKLAPNGKVEYKEEATFDYLVILTNASGEVTLDESRLEDKASAARRRKNIPLLVSNGFAMLFLVFHPYYQDSFEFSETGEEMRDGRRTLKIAFHHLRGTRTPMALSLRGREYPVDLDGTAWVDPETGTILHMEAAVDTSVQDLGMRALRSEVRFSPAVFRDGTAGQWLPLEAVVEVETPHQHWRNTHSFTDYKRFSVDTEQVVNDKDLEKKQR